MVGWIDAKRRMEGKGKTDRAADKTALHMRALKEMNTADAIWVTANASLCCVWSVGILSFVQHEHAPRALFTTEKQHFGSTKGFTLFWYSWPL